MAAFARVLADHGYAGATIAAVAAEAGLAPGLIHHHFESKADLLGALLHDLIARFRTRVRRYESDQDGLLAYVDGALKLDGDADQLAARCWVGLFAEAIRTPALFAQMRRLIDSGDRRHPGPLGPALLCPGGRLGPGVRDRLPGPGCLRPRKTAGFAAPGLRRLVAALARG